MFKLFKVSGTSMQPTVFPGDYIIATSIIKNSLLKNRLVIFFDNIHSYVLKRVCNYHKSSITLKSDNVLTSSIFCKKRIQKKEVLFIVLFILKKRNFDIFINLKNKFFKKI